MFPCVDIGKVVDSVLGGEGAGGHIPPSSPPLHTHTHRDKQTETVRERCRKGERSMFLCVDIGRVVDRVLGGGSHDEVFQHVQRVENVLGREEGREGSHPLPPSPHTCTHKPRQTDRDRERCMGVERSIPCSCVWT